MRNVALADSGMPSPGTLLDGKYRLVRQLGAGGMGIVYEADHIRLRQPFAIKILQPELAQESEFLMRFEREARAAAILRSPHIVRVFDVDVSAEGLTYMVMELLEGRDLAAEALEGPVAPEQLVDWLVQICSALQEAHDNGIVHRDLKPPNIFLTRIESGERIAKVLDFGISKLEATSTSHVTGHASGTLGTPRYMAPEQIRSRNVDARADLWALGVMMYRLLADRWPFTGEGDAVYMAAVLTDPAIPFEQVRPDLPHELASAIMKALEKDPASRHQSAKDMAAALAPFGSGSGPLPARSSLPVGGLTPLQGTRAVMSLTPRRVVGGPDAILMAAAPEDRSDPAGSMATVVDATRPEVRSSRSLAAASAPAMVFVAPPSRASKGRAVAIAAAVLFASVGLGSYVFMTTRKSAPNAPAASAEIAAPSAALSLAGSALPPATAAAVPAAQSASATAAPSASALVRRKRRPHPATSASAGGGPPPDNIPDHL